MAQETITFADLGYENGDDVTEVTGTNVTLTFDQGEGTNAPKYYSTGEALRMYAGNTMTVESTKDIASVEFTSASGASEKQVISSDDTFSSGSYSDGVLTSPGKSFTYTVDNTKGRQARISVITFNFSDGTQTKIAPGLKVNDVTATEGDEVELTVNTSSDGAITFSTSDASVATVSKSGSSYVLKAVAAGTAVITVKQAETAEYLAAETTFNVKVNAYIAPGSYATVSVPYEVNFKNTQDQFVIEDVSNNTGDAIWKQGSQYGMTATSYINRVNLDGDSWLVSPIIDLTSASTATLTFSDQVNKFFTDLDEEVTVNVREEGGSWTNLNVAHSKPASGTWGGWVDQTVDLAAYAGKKIQIGYHYIGYAASAGTYEVQSFKVVAEEVVVKKDAELSFEPSGNFTAYIGEDNEFPTLVNPNQLEVTYTSSNENAATVDATGTVTLVGAGNTTIKATFAGNDEYNEGDASYYLIVKERAIEGTDEYVLVTSADDLNADDKIIIVNTDNDYAISTTQNNNNRGAAEVALKDGSDDTIIPSNQVQVITLEDGDGDWLMNVGNGYLYAASTTGNQLKTQDEASEKAHVTFEIDGDGNAVILFAQWDADGKARNLVRYNANNGNPIFSCYASTATTGTGTRVYKKATADTPKQAAGLAYDESEFTATIGQDNEFPTLSNPNNLDVTYTSSNESVATIDASGAITLIAEGTTTIKAESEENDTYKAGSASYTLTVVEVFEPKTYELVTNVKSLEDGDNILFVSPDYAYVMSTNQKPNNRGAVESGVDANYEITSTADMAAIVLHADGDGIWSFEVTNGDKKGYLYAPGDGNYMRTQDEAAEATVEIASDGTASINFVAEVDQTSVRFNGGNNLLFSCYNPAKTGLPEILIFREVKDYVDVEITAAGYATLYYGSKDLVVPTGVTAYTYIAKKTGMEISKTYKAGDVIAAGTAVVLEGAESMYQFNVSKTSGVADANNMLLGFDGKQETVGPDASGSYLFYGLSTNNAGTVGFYFLAEEGAAFQSEPHKAYLAVPTDVAAAYYTFDGSSDGINTIAGVSADNSEVYTLSGVRVNGQLQKGIYIVNGKKFVVK